MNTTTKKLGLASLICAMAMGCATETAGPDHGASTHALSGGPVEYTLLHVAADPRLEVRSSGVSDSFAVSALVDQGATAGDQAFLVVEAECEIRRVRVVCPGLGYAPIVETRAVGDERITVVDFSEVTLAPLGSLTWLWALEDDDTTYSGVNAGDECFGGGSHSQPGAQECHPVDGLSGEVCCNTTCAFDCVPKDGGGYVWKAGACETDEASCKYMPSAGTDFIPEVQPSF